MKGDAGSTGLRHEAEVCRPDGLVRKGMLNGCGRGRPPGGQRLPKKAKGPPLQPRVNLSGCSMIHRPPSIYGFANRTHRYYVTYLRAEMNVRRTCDSMISRAHEHVCDCARMSHDECRACFRGAEAVACRVRANCPAAPASWPATFILSGPQQAVRSRSAVDTSSQRGWAGRTILKVEPFPSALSTSIRPPWSFTIDWLMLRPSPVPPALVV